MKKLGMLAFAASLFAFGASASAATVSFGNPPNGPLDPWVENGYEVSGTANRVSGQCASGSCLRINPGQGQGPGEVATLTQTGGGAFDLLSFWFYLDGETSFLRVTPIINGVDQSPTFDFDVDASAPATVTLASDNSPVTTLASNTPYIWTGLISGVTAVRFNTIGTGTIRIDNINAIPLPPAALLFGTALAGMGFMSRRKKAKVAA